MNSVGKRGSGGEVCIHKDSAGRRENTRHTCVVGRLLPLQ